jgi:hypothetical protein
LEYGNQIWKCLGENSVYVMLHWEWKANLEMLHGKIKSKSGFFFFFFDDNNVYVNVTWDYEK